MYTSVITKIIHNNNDIWYDKFRGQNVICPRSYRGQGQGQIVKIAGIFEFLAYTTDCRYIIQNISNILAIISHYMYKGLELNAKTALQKHMYCLLLGQYGLQDGRQFLIYIYTITSRCLWDTGCMCYQQKQYQITMQHDLLMLIWQNKIQRSRSMVIQRPRSKGAWPVCILPHIVSCKY